MTVGLIGNPEFSFISWGLNYGFAYELPTNASYFARPGSQKVEREAETRPMMQRRYRRDLYSKMEIIMNELVFTKRNFFLLTNIKIFRMGYDGRDCILRALCESSQFFGKKESNMVSEIIRVAFSFPKSMVLPSEHKELAIYDAAHRKGKTYASCAKIFPNCGFSLLQLAMGRYSDPKRNYM